tara:strand:- start:406 stop:873 length:468 start_codon:yes stop_codon:yes gene_type:complete
MATTLTASTLKVSVKEEITLNGKKHEYRQEQSIADVNMIAQRIVRVPYTGTEIILSFGSAIGAGTYVAGDVKYIRVTNLDNANFVKLGLLDNGAGDRAYFKLEKGATMVFHNTKLDAKESTSGAWVAFADIESINARADTGDVDIEIFVASSQSN